MSSISVTTTTTGASPSSVSVVDAVSQVSLTPSDPVTDESSSSTAVFSVWRAPTTTTTQYYVKPHPRRTPFSSLLSSSSPRIRELIFSQLDLRSKKSARLVCRRWQRCVDKTLSFRIELTDFTHNYVENFGRTRPVVELLVGFLSVPYPVDGWNLHRVLGLSILSDYRFQVTYRTNERVLDHNGMEIKSLPTTTVAVPSLHQQQQPSLAMVVMSEQKLERLFNEFRGVRRLTVSSMALADVKDNSFLAKLQLNSLREISVSQEWDHGMCGVRDLLSNTFPRLRAVSLYMNCDDDLTLYAEVFQFVGRHCSTVTSLRVSFLRASLSHHADPNNNENEGTQIVNLTKDHRLDHVVYADLLKQLSTVRLRDIHIHALSTEGLLRNNLELHLLGSQVSLVSLRLTNLRVENMPVWRRVPLVIEACSRTLKHLVLDGCFCECDVARNPPGPFPGSWVKACRRLETLEVLVCGVKVKGILRIPPKVKKLCLGHVLTARQLQTVLGGYFGDLEELALPQSHVRSQGVSSSVVQSSLSLPMTTTADAVSLSRSSTVGGGLQSRPCALTLSHFKSALSLPKLRKLSLLTKTCRYKKIRRYAAGLIGVVENPVPESVFSGLKQMKTGALKRGDVEFVIDRDVFSPQEDDEEEEETSRASSKASSKFK